MVRIIGDIHGKKDKHLSLMQGAEYSLQVGDLGFDYQYLIENNIDPIKHRFFMGNHDNYDKIDQVPHCLGDFGVWSVPNFGDVFFVRGAWSIDFKRRTIGIDWWHDEELSYRKCEEVIELYTQVKPKILITHACPANIIRFLIGPDGARRFGYDQAIVKTKTDDMLQTMLAHHLPRLHIFGHYHRHFDRWIDGRCGIELPADSPINKETTEDYTRYVCVPEFGVFELTKSIFEE